jgi:hypothetical protein
MLSKQLLHEEMGKVTKQETMLSKLSLTKCDYVAFEWMKIYTPILIFIFYMVYSLVVTLTLATSVARIGLIVGLVVIWYP